MAKPHDYNVKQNSYKEDNGEEYLVEDSVEYKPQDESYDEDSKSAEYQEEKIEYVEDDSEAAVQASDTEDEYVSEDSGDYQESEQYIDDSNEGEEYFDDGGDVEYQDDSFHSEDVSTSDESEIVEPQSEMDYTVQTSEDSTLNSEDVVETVYEEPAIQTRELSFEVPQTEIVANIMDESGDKTEMKPASEVVEKSPDKKKLNPLVIAVAAIATYFLVG